MSRVLSIFLVLAMVAGVVVLIGLITRAPRFGALREGVGRQVRSAMDILDEGVESQAEPILDD